MKNIVTILVLVFAFTFTAQAQKKGKGKKASVEKMLKRMTGELNLTEAQQSDIKPILVKQFAERKEMAKKRKAMKESGTKPTKEERKQQRNLRMEKEAVFNTKMARILNAEQLAKFNEIAKQRNKKGKGNKKKKKDN
jgi:Spy/CpxP family protein refolding chaperone